MYVYLSFFFVSSTLIFLASRAPISQAKTLVFIVFILLILFSGLRGLVGSDTSSYLLFYDLFKDPEMLSIYLAKMEPFFVLLVSLHSNIVDSKFMYIFMMSVFQGGLLYFVFRDSGNKYLFLLCYVLLFYLNFHFNTTRAAIAVMFFLISLTSESKKVKVFSAILAPGFHLSVLFFYPLLFTRMDLKSFLIFVLFLIFGFALLTQHVDFFIAKYNLYENYMGGNSSGISLSGSIMFVSVLASILFLRKLSRIFLGASFLFLSSIVINEFYSIGYRFIIIGLLLYLYFLLEELSKRNSRVGYFFFWAPVLLNFAILIKSIPEEPLKLEERALRGEDVSKAINSTYIPYEFYWNDSDI